MTENATPEPQFAHVIVPDPIQPDASPDNVISKLAKYHATRAQAFHIGTVNGHYSVNALISLTHEYHLAALYAALDETPAGASLDKAILEIAVNMRAFPHLIGPHIHELLTRYGVDPASIKAYRP